MTKPGEIDQWIAEVLTVKTDGCVLWPFTIQQGKLKIQGPGGYGRVRGKPAHNLICRKAHGDPPAGKTLALHSCHVRLCCNPAHLHWGTHKENTADMIAAGRQPWPIMPGAPMWQA